MDQPTNLENNFTEEELDAKVSFGVDVVEIPRMEEIISRTPSFTKYTFTEDEISYCNSCAKPAIHFATHFAAKEAVLKALGTGFTQGIGPKDVEVLHNKWGKPYVVLHGNALSIFKDLEYSEIPISLSYTHKEAVGCAITLKKDSSESSSAKFTVDDVTAQLTKQFKQVKKMIDKKEDE